MPIKIITIANRKGGAGKSTCAAHFALEASTKNNKVILLDLDPQKTLESWWEKRTEENPYMADASAQNLREKIALIKTKGFDYCIIDTPGDTSINAVEAIKLADLIIIPCKPTSPDLKAIGRTISMVQENNKNYIFVLTQTISKATSTIQAASVLSDFGPIAPATIANRIAYANAMSSGGTACELDKNAAIEVQKVWEFIMKKLDIKYVNESGKEKI
ncbi:plasmid partitioning-family protein [Reticulomyxa filosa]|uniref:Plasmid partitioning-family protein n=1 Tax=Reticulomyxa filosa TaxID=46433 RepID=X6MN60_RETFI|nr:plasmid partitioning-family protein [Reticulomyxa filosa]|eukprot:ETO15111.1 plasmid partitioning-family protein [Reticulomyxa filosa]